MAHQNKVLSTLLQVLDLGSSVAESDTLLEAARIETSAFADLLNDRVDLIPGTKGSGTGGRVVRPISPFGCPALGF